MNQAFVDLLTRTFASGALQHPGDANTPARLIPLPGFRSAGMGDDQTQEMIGAAAKLWAEAIGSVTDNEFEVLSKADAAQLRQAAADAPDGTRIIRVYDRADHQRTKPLLELTIGKTDDVTVDSRLLRKLGA